MPLSDQPDLRTWRESVRPPGWRLPEPHDVYDLVVIGGGTGGLVSAMGAAGLGARVALVERHQLGGDCLNTGCVPSKALLRSARAIGEAKRAPQLGVRVGAVEPDFRAIMRRMHERRAGLSPNDSADRLQRAGVHVFFGEAGFVNRKTVQVAGRVLRFNRAVIATGGRPTIPPVPGLADVPLLTNETVFALEDLPRRFLILGAGPIGCELAQAFARFGSSVTVLDQADRILPREDADAASIVERALVADGVRLELGVRIMRAQRAEGAVRLMYERGGQSGEASGDQLLVAAGRAPNVEGLGLDAAGVSSAKRGVVVNDRLRTSNPRIYAVGDVCSAFQFTHAADAMARIAIQNALFYGRRRAGALVMPWCTYTDPELAHVGLSEEDARRRGRGVASLTVDLAEVDRAVLDDEAHGFVRVHHARGRLLGCTIVASHAGELIAEAAFAITHGHSLTDLSATIHPYPTQAEALRKAGDQYRRSLVTPRVRRFFERYFQWTR